MNRMWVRLSLAFSGLILIGAALIVMVPVLTMALGHSLWNPDRNLPPFPGTRVLPLEKRLAWELGTFYESRQSWDGVEDFLAGAQTAVFPLAVGIIDVEQVGPELELDPVEKGRKGGDRVDRAPIVVDGQVVGYLELRYPRDEGFTARERQILMNVTQALIATVMAGGVIAILAGVLMSRRVTSRLGQLAKAARAIGSRDLSQRVEVRGSTEVVELATAFNEMARDLEQAENLRGNMVADVAHELRTPLSVLQGNLRAILDDVYPLDKAEVAGLFDQTRHLSRMVDDLHVLSQAEARQLSLNFQAVDVANLVQAVESALEPVTEAEGVILKTEVAENLPPVEADSARLTQVLHNLSTNALRHTPEGGTIWLRAGTDSDVGGKPTELWLSVEDSGEGISPEHLPYVFERFYRADSSRTRTAGGAGLGLAIARAIVESHDGRIEVASDGVPGHGSCFKIYLPLSHPKSVQ